MATTTFTNAMFKINGTDVSAYAKSITLNYSAEMLDKTAFGVTSRARTGGLKSWGFDVKFNQDFAVLDALLFPLVGTTSCVQCRAVNAIESATNPDYNGVVVLEKYPPLTGNVGALLEASVSFQSAGDLARNTSST
jgi:hypothetical protein